MKLFISIVFLVIPVAAAAQNYQGRTEADVQNMMQKMQEMQECVAKVDQAELEALDKRSQKFKAELKTLCEQGKRDAAQKKAIAYGKEMMKNPALKQMKKCSEITRDMMPGGKMPSSNLDFDYSNRHVCDE